MTVQLPQPGTCPRNMSRRDPGEALAEIERDKGDAIYAIELVLDRYAEAHGIRHEVLHKAVLGYIDDLVSDLFYEKEEELLAELEADISRENQ